MARSAWKSDSCKWNIMPIFNGAEDLGDTLRMSPLIAQLLYNRGVMEHDAARSFLRPRLKALCDPVDLPGCKEGAERIARAVKDRRKICIYGDYDVDGITGTAIMISCIRMCGGEVDYYVPHRLEEGYGLNAGALQEIADLGAELVITVDCGVSSAELVSRFSGQLDILVTDHHSLPETIPEGAGVVHPCLGDEYSNPDLCGAGVAFKLAWQTAREICGSEKVDKRMRNFLLEVISLAGLGTIADYVPLVGENRIIATYGLRGLPSAPNNGIKALLRSTGLEGRDVDSFHVGFVLAPRLNAAGRMGHARDAVDLLTTDSPGRAVEIAGRLEQKNEQRKKIERQITDEAIAMVRSEGLDDSGVKALVLASDSWHGGVIGIVASRLVDEFSRPAVVINIGENGTAQGSARSISGFHMSDALDSCSDHLLSYGGHAMAGGLRMEISRIDAFKKAFLALAEEHISADRFLPTLDVDAEVSVDDLGYSVVRLMDSMGPFGPGNPRPLVVLRGCELSGEAKRMGRRGTTIGLLLDQNGRYIRAVGFQMSRLPDYLAGSRKIDVVGQPVLNRFRGNSNVELEIKDVRRADEK